MTWSKVTKTLYLLLLLCHNVEVLQSANYQRLLLILRKRCIYGSISRTDAPAIVIKWYASTKN